MTRLIYAALIFLLAAPAMANEAMEAAISDCQAKGLGTRALCTEIATKLGKVGAALGRDSLAACQRTPNGYSSYEVCIEQQKSASGDIILALMGDLFIRKHRDAIRACMSSANSPVQSRDCMVEKMPDYMASVRAAAP